MPTPVSPGHSDGGYGEPVLPVTEYGPGVEAVRSVPGYGKPVYFVDGLPAEFDPAEQHDIMLQAAIAHASMQADAAARAERRRLAEYLLLLW
jgi:hypothetical protein